MKWRPASVSGSRSSSRASRRNRAIQAKIRSTTQRRGRRTKPRFASGSATTSRRCRGPGRSRSTARRCSPGRPRPTRRSRRWRPASPASASTGARSSRRPASRSARPAGPACPPRGAPSSRASLVPVLTGPRAALGGAAQRPAVQNGCRRLLPAPRRQPQQRAQVVRQRLEAARLQPPHACSYTVCQAASRRHRRHGMPWRTT